MSGPHDAHFKSACPSIEKSKRNVHGAHDKFDTRQTQCRCCFRWSSTSYTVSEGCGLRGVFLGRFASGPRLSRASEGRNASSSGWVLKELVFCRWKRVNFARRND